MISKYLLLLFLLDAGFTREESKVMVCIAELESSLNPLAVNDKLNKDNSIDYGLFQINDRLWFKACNLTPVTALEIKPNIKCARMVYKQLGFNAWVAYRNKGKVCPNFEERDQINATDN